MNIFKSARGGSVFGNYLLGKSGEENRITLIEVGWCPVLKSKITPDE